MTDVVMRFPQASDIGYGCPHAVLVMLDGDCGAIQCEVCCKRWCGNGPQEVASMKTKDCNPQWFRALKAALSRRRSPTRRKK